MINELQERYYAQFMKALAELRQAHSESALSVDEVDADFAWVQALSDEISATLERRAGHSADSVRRWRKVVSDSISRGTPDRG